MISEELKKIVEQLGGLVIVENSQPKFVVISYEKYKELVIPELIREGSSRASDSYGVIHKNIDNSGNFDKDSNEEVVERLNKEISALKEQVSEKERELTGNL